MELIDLYTREVGRHLPEKTRADIEKEIRSMIEDTLEDESQKAGRPADEDMLVEVLKRMGPPGKMAASYLPERYLIGPELFPHYLNTLRIVLAIVAIVSAIAVGVSLGAARPDSIIDVFLQIIGGMIDAMLTSAAIVTIVFAVFQYVSPGMKIDTPEWDPRKLTAEPDPERVSIPEALSEVIFNVLGLVIFNFYPQWIGISIPQDGRWLHLPLLSDSFFRYLPWLSAIWIIEAILNAWLVARGRWTKAARWVSVILSVLTVAVLAWILIGPSFITIQSETFEAFGWNLPGDAAQRIYEGLNISIRLVLGLVIGLQILEAGKQIVKLFGSRLPQELVTEK